MSAREPRWEKVKRHFQYKPYTAWTQIVLVALVVLTTVLFPPIVLLWALIAVIVGIGFVAIKLIDEAYK